MTLKADTCYSG